MLNRVGVLGGLVVGMLAGWLFAAPPARAQSSSVPAPSGVVMGADLLLQFSSGVLSTNISSMRCSVRSVEGTWVVCATPDAFDAERGLKWVNLTYVTQITRRDK